MIKNICLLVLVFLLICSCENRNSGELDKKDIIIMEKIIDTISSKKAYGSKYLINPYLDSFEFHPYFIKHSPTKYMDARKTEVFESLSINEDGFEIMKNKVNNNYSSEVYHPELLSLSNSDSSNWVYTFSGFGDNIIFVELRGVCGNKILREDLMKTNFFIEDTDKKGELESIVFIIEENTIAQVIPIDGSTRECF